MTAEPLNPYAAPQSATPPVPLDLGPAVCAWRGLLLMRHDSKAPLICVQRGVPAAPHQQITRTMHWAPLWLLLLVPLCLAPYLLGSYLLAHSATVTFSLCRSARLGRLAKLIVCWAVAALGLYCVAAPLLGAEAALLRIFGIALIVGAVIYGKRTAAVLKPVRIDAAYAYLKGAHPNLLEQLPAWTPPSPATFLTSVDDDLR